MKYAFHFNIVQGASVSRTNTATDGITNFIYDKLQMGFVNAFQTIRNQPHVTSVCHGDIFENFSLKIKDFAVEIMRYIFYKFLFNLACMFVSVESCN